MYNLLIVDDEASVRSGLRECVDWTALGIHVAGEAEDGEMALEFIRRAAVDIVVTDVKMPHMDGIGLAEALRLQAPGVKVVFVSGFAEVDYLKSALKLDAIDYILKPVRIRELQEVFGRIVRLLDDENEQRHHLMELHIKLNQSIPLLRERFLTALALDGAAGGRDLREKFEFLGIRLPPDGQRFGCFVIRIDDYRTVFEGKPEKEKQLISFAIVNICEDIVSSHLCGHAFESKPGEYAVLVHFGPDAEEEQLFSVIQNCKAQINRLFKLEVTIGVGSTVQEWAELPSSYKLAVEAAEHKWFLGKNKIISIDSLSETKAAGSERSGTFNMSEFTAALKSSEWEEVVSCLEQALDATQRSGMAAAQQMRNTYVHLLVACSDLLLELGLLTEKLQLNERNLWEAAFRLETGAELKAAFLAYIRLVFDAIAEKRERKTSNVIGHVQAYIEEHYAEELTIADIAASVYLTTTYVCLLFKQETGKTVNEFVIEVRMREAKTMLADPKYKLYDICYAVGYKDPSYFSKLFKKQCGLSPSEYRDRML